MLSLHELLANSAPALLFTVVGLGYFLGNIRVRGFSLGIAAVLFVGLVFGALDPVAFVLPEVICERQPIAESRKPKEDAPRAVPTIRGASAVRCLMSDVRRPTSGVRRRSSGISAPPTPPSSHRRGAPAPSPWA